jgi:hypothetical protein
MVITVMVKVVVVDSVVGVVGIQVEVNQAMLAVLERSSYYEEVLQYQILSRIVNTLKLYCILASCYIRFTLNICSFVHQCNMHFLFSIKQATWRPQRQHKYSNERTLTISTTSGEAHGWQHHIGKNWHNRAAASGEYTITPEDGSVRPKYVDD